MGQSNWRKHEIQRKELGLLYLSRTEFEHLWSKHRRGLGRNREDILGIKTGMMFQRADGLHGIGGDALLPRYGQDGKSLFRPPRKWRLNPKKHAERDDLPLKDADGSRDPNALRFDLPGAKLLCDADKFMAAIRQLFANETRGSYLAFEKGCIL